MTNCSALRSLPFDSCRSQRGLALFIALIALVIMSLAGVALMRTVDTASLIAGNLAFRQAAVNAADTGVEAAMTLINNTISANPDAKNPAGCADPTTPPAAPAGSCNSYPTLGSDNATTGLPEGINWGTGGVAATTVNGVYAVQYVIERMCSPGTNFGNPRPTLTDAAPRCFTEPLDPLTSAATGRFTGAPPSRTDVEIYYRVTVRVTGPRNTTTTLQTIVARRNA